MKKAVESASKLLVVEINKDDTPEPDTLKELHGAILSLQSHPGFEELLRRMRVSRQILRARLENGNEDANRHELRALIQAYSFLERQLRTEVGKAVEKPREAFAEEQLEYERLRQFVEVIGQQQSN